MGPAHKRQTVVVVRRARKLAEFQLHGVRGGIVAVHALRHSGHAAGAKLDDQLILPVPIHVVYGKLVDRDAAVIVVIAAAAVGVYLVVEKRR